MLCTRFEFSTTPQSRAPSLGRHIASSPNDATRQFAVDHDATPRANRLRLDPEPMLEPTNDDDPPTPSTICCSPRTPSDAHPIPNTLLEGSRGWQWNLDDHLVTVFSESVLSLPDHAIDEAVTRMLQLIDRPTRAKIRRLALAVCTHWMRMQFRYKNTNVYVAETVGLISRIVEHLGRLSPHAQNDFSDELDFLCLEKLKRTWSWYVDVTSRDASPIPRKNMFMRLMAVVVMVSSLFHGGQLRYGTVLDGLEYIATMSPWPDAVAATYALLHELGPKFALGQAGWDFIQHLLAALFPFTKGRTHVDPLCQLVSAINGLVAEWDNRTRVTLYQTKGNNQFHV